MKQIYLLKRTKLFIIGFIFLSSIHVAYGQDGTLDTGFNPGTGFNTDVFSTAAQSDGKIVVGGNFTPNSGMLGFRIARLNADGSQDSSFNTGTGFSNDVRCVTLQSDGKIIVVGEFTTFNGVTRNRIARLNTDGSLDTTFDPGAGFNFYALQALVQPDGKILVVGSFTGTSRNYIARLNSDGTLDTNFNTGSGFNNVVYYATLQNDGKILTGGNFSSYNGVSRAKIARLNPDGTLDTTFNSGSTGFNNFIFALSIQADNKIIVGGWFTAYNGTTRNRIARLNTDGSLDTTFNPGSGFNSNVYVTKIQEDGKIVIGGDYTSFNGTTRNNIARLDSNGNLDTTFNIGTGFNSYVRSLSIQTDGKILAGGSFTTYNGATRTRIARINGTTLGINEKSMLAFDYYPNPTENNLYIKSNLPINAITISNMFGHEIKTISINSNEADINFQDLPTAIYFVTVSSNGANESFKVVKK